jgi:acetyl-CoA acetyltransferase
MQDIVIVSAARTAVGKFGGSLAKTPATELGAIVIKEALARARIGLDQVGEVIMGQVLAAGAGQNPARQALMKAGVAKETRRLRLRPEGRDAGRAVGGLGRQRDRGGRWSRKHERQPACAAEFA